MEHRRITIMSMFVAAAVALLAGCANQHNATRLSDAATAYEAGDYDAAHVAASEVMQTGNYQQKTEAAYIAGLSSYQTGDYVRAETEMQRAAQSSDPQTVGKASAMLGAIRLEQDRPADAAAYYRSAARNLEGDEARRAANQAALAYDRSDNSASETAPRQSTYDLDTETFTTRTRFCLQVGVFRETSRARTAASQAENTAVRFGLAPVRIIESADVRGRPLQFVQMGDFATRRDAEAARRRLDRLDIIVAPRREER